MNNKKASGLSLGVVGIVFLIYNLFVWILLKPQATAFWISYAFMLVAFAALILSMYLAAKTLDVETVFFGIPLMQFALFYFIAELFASVVFMLFQKHLGYKIPLLVQAVLLAIFALFAILSVAGRDATKAVKEDYKQKTADIKGLGVDVELLANETADPNLKRSLKRLAENIRFSDPMTNDAVADVELRIRQMVNELRIACEDGDAAAAADLCAKLDRAIVERNKKLLVTK